MQTDNRFFDDLARMMSGAAGAFSGLRSEFDQLVKSQMERMVAQMDLVPREEFEAVRAMAQAARLENEKLAARLAQLEARLERLTSGSDGG